MDALLLIGMLSAVAASVVFRGLWLIRVLTVGLLVGAVFLAVVAASFAPRQAADRQYKQGKWTEEFRDGSFLTYSLIKPTFPYFLVATVGLGFLAIVPVKKNES